MSLSPFSQRVRAAFSRRVASYEPMAPLQRGMAWRLAGVAAHRFGHGHAPTLPDGPCADLGAGTGLVGRALAAWQVGLPTPLQQLDLCPEALARNGAGPTLPWDLNQELPPQLAGAALLTSSFALQWLEAPAESLNHWGEQLAPGGWLLLSVPTAGSFPEWRQAARHTGLPCSALPLPAADTLRAAAARAGLQTIQAQVLTFSGQQRGAGSRRAPGPTVLPGASGRAGLAGGLRAADPAAAPARTRPASAPSTEITPSPGALRASAPGPHPALEALRAMRAIGADATPRASSLSPGDWRRLLAAWPAGGCLSWEVLLLVARKPLCRSASIYSQQAGQRNQLT
jgi:malonyl-CoA O-methyltransferase